MGASGRASRREHATQSIRRPNPQLFWVSVSAKFPLSEMPYGVLDCFVIIRFILVLGLLPSWETRIKCHPEANSSGTTSSQFTMTSRIGFKLNQVDLTPIAIDGRTQTIAVSCTVPTSAFSVTLRSSALVLEIS